MTIVMLPICRVEMLLALVRGANAGKRLRRHWVNRLVLGNAQRIFVADQGLGMKFE